MLTFFNINLVKLYNVLPKIKLICEVEKWRGYGSFPTSALESSNGSFLHICEVVATPENF